MTGIPPEQLPERELFAEYVELLKQREMPADSYEEVNLHKRQACLLAEIGERLETLEAAKSLLKTTQSGERKSTQQRNQ